MPASRNFFTVVHCFFYTKSVGRSVRRLGITIRLYRDNFLCLRGVVPLHSNCHYRSLVRFLVASLRVLLVGSSLAAAADNYLAVVGNSWAGGLGVVEEGARRRIVADSVR